MKVENKNKGGLVYLPSNVKLYQFEGSEYPGTVLRHTETTKPMNVLSLGKRGHSPGDFIEVLYNAEKWCVKLKDVFEIRSL